MRRPAAAVSGLVAAALLLAVSGCADDGAPARSDAATTAASEPREVPVVGGTLRLGIARLSSLDPAAAGPDSPSAAIAADLLFDGLTTVAPGASGASPAVASEWTTPDAARTWQFTISQEARFSDGRAISAADVEFSLERLISQGAASLVASRLDAIVGFTEFLTAGGRPAGADLAGIRAPDADTVEFALARPMAWLPELLSAPAYGIVSRAGVESDGPAFGEGPTVASGPFRLAERDGDVVSLVRSPDRGAFLDQIDLYQHDDLAVAFDSFEEGRLDWTLVPPSRVDVAAERYGTAGFAPFQAELYFGFNLADARFADVRFRQAIVQAVDRDAIVNAVYFGFAEPLFGVIPDGVAGADPRRCGAGCTPDTAAAQALLAQAFPAGGVPEVIVDYQDGADEAAVAGIVEQNLEAIGIPVTLRPHPSAEFSAFAISGAQGFISLGWIGVQGSPEDYVDRLFRTGSSDNLTGFTDPAVDALLDQAATTLDPDERVRLVGEAEAAVLAQAPALPLAQFHLLSVASDDVRDLELGVTGTFDAESTWLAP